MKVQNKPDYLIFADSAKKGENAEFPDVGRGWGITIDQTASKPPMEWMNGAFNRIDKNMLYLLQQGVPEWSEKVTYPVNAIIKYNGVLYTAIVENENSIPTTSTTKWKKTQAEIPIANTHQKGIVQLNSSTNSTSEADAATPFAVKKANDLAITANKTANGAVQRSGDNMNGELFIKNKRVLVDGEAYPFRGHLNNTHLNNIKGLQHGVYFQPANELATIENGYPIGSAGALIVTQTGGDGANGCIQTYTDYYSGRQFVRTYRDMPNIWMSWIEQITTANGNFILPVGVPLPWSLPVPPEGWFNCNGSPFDKKRCPKLAFAYPSGYLPDLRGEFIRGWDDSRGIDRYRGLLTWQNHQVAAHRHVGGWGENFSNLNTENRQRVAPFGCTGEGGSWIGATSNDNDNPLFYTNDGTNGSITNPKGVTSWFNLNADGLVGYETRPRNIAFNYIVKAE
ncbi:tail fiber protein [uncultured Gilliamella sp.]|uniref:tail fiber protein n=1 Tax=uncultured Gilliamella sp. TaxID=1193505 RepID=UPI0025D41DA0|nr:tail fiber protein [uncultured Gilliamella sp.]